MLLCCLLYFERTSGLLFIGEDELNNVTKERKESNIAVACCLVKIGCAHGWLLAWSRMASSRKGAVALC